MQCGEVVLIMGLFGSGKIMLLLMFGVMLWLLFGSVEVDGVDLVILFELKLLLFRVRRFGFVF